MSWIVGLRENPYSRKKRREAKQIEGRLEEGEGQGEGGMGGRGRGRQREGRRKRERENQERDRERKGIKSERDREE